MTDLAQDLAFLSDEDNKSPMEDMDDSDIGEMELETARASPEPPSSPELHCVGCDISSKADCPVGKLMKKRKHGDNSEVAKAAKVQWGKTSTRSVWRTSKKGRRYKKKVLKKCGEWCGVCSTVAKKFLTRGKYKRMMIKKESSKDRFDENAAKKL